MVPTGTCGFESRENQVRKDVCQACVNRMARSYADKPFIDMMSWTKQNDELWAVGRLDCPWVGRERLLRYGPPNSCPYQLEHLVLEQACLPQSIPENGVEDRIDSMEQE